MTTREKIESIYGSRLPLGATSFGTFGGATTFCIGRTGELVDVPWTGDDEDRLRELGIIGTFGQQID